METERVFLLLAACASAAWARGKGGAGTGGGGNSWRGGEMCSLMMLVVIIAGMLVGEFVIHAQDLRFLKSLGLEDP